MTEWYSEAQRLVGTREVQGPGNSPTIMGWIKGLGSRILGIAVNADSVPWCGTFVAHCMNTVGIAPAKIAVRAKSWATWGDALNASELAPGAVLVFERPGGGHVGFYYGEDATCYHVLGGNQSDMVNVTRIEKRRCVARRWPSGEPLEGGPVHLTASGEISSNEA